MSEEYEFEMVQSEPLEKLFEKAGENAGELWLWCIYCERFFQAKHLRIDFLGNRQGCAFCNCAGFGCAIFLWNTFQNDSWPLVEDLRHGLALPKPEPVAVGSYSRRARQGRRKRRRSKKRR